MSSMVLWNDPETHVTASWHKGNTFTVDRYELIDGGPMARNLSTTYHRTSDLAIKAAKRLATKVRPEARKATVRAMCEAAGFEIWNSGGNIMLWAKVGLDDALYTIASGDESECSDLWGDPDVGCWGICRTHAEGWDFDGTDSDYQDKNCEHTLRDALAEVAEDIARRGASYVDSNCG
jgi:hypothetical protein